MVEDNWILIKDKLPELEIEVWKDRIIQISKPVKAKLTNGDIYTARYVFSIADSERPFPRLYWQICEDENNIELPVDTNGNDCWMELLDEYEGE